MVRCMRCRADMLPARVLLCLRCSIDLGPETADIVVKAYDAHEATGCTCDRKYAWTCPRFLAAITGAAHA